MECSSNLQTFSDTLYPVGDGLVLRELGFDILELVCKSFVFTLGVNRKFVSQRLYHLDSFSTFLALAGL